MNFLKICNRIIEYSFYGLFFLVPLVFTSATSELFELNKMWLTWALTIAIITAWLTKMALERRILFCRTPLDIPIALFLLSQIISTIFSLDSHTSLWGYYSRFNGGLLSIFSYILLYYAFLSNFDSQKLSAVVRRLLAISLISGTIAALWGLPSHFGYDPTCLLFRGTLDVSCWTADFMPKVRIFSTLGQPNWLAAYLAILIPITIAFATKNSKSEAPNPKQSQNLNSQIFKIFLNFGDLNLFRISILVLLILFYVDLLFTRAQSGFLAVWISLIFFFGVIFWMKKKNLKSLILNHSSLIIIGILLLITFVIGTPINQLHKFTLPGLQAPKPPITENVEKPTAVIAGGTESGDIRLYVWEGALNAWKSNPLFGTGVETFAFAYYKYKPVGHNLTSEWNFLYNKAHNEYLNYLATTGIAGLGAYFSMIFVFLWICMKYFASSIKEKIHNTNYLILNTALVAGYISILVTNFFGFSVVITNIYLFMIPAFVFVLSNMIKDESKDQRLKTKDQNLEMSLYQWTLIFFIILASLFMIYNLFRFWRADIHFALGYNLDRAGEYQQAYSSLHKAIELRGDEPVFKDELSINNALIASSLLSQTTKENQEQSISVASALAQEAIDTSNEVVSKYPNNAVFWKTRTRVFYTLSQVDPRYLPRALDSIRKAALLAPNDANIIYNLGVLYGQNNDIDKGIETLEQVIKFKPDYKDAHFGLGLFYRQKGDKQKSIAQMQYILENISPNDPGALESIKSWTLDK